MENPALKADIISMLREPLKYILHGRISGIHMTPSDKQISERLLVLTYHFLSKNSFWPTAWTLMRTSGTVRGYSVRRKFKTANQRGVSVALVNLHENSGSYALSLFPLHR